MGPLLFPTKLESCGPIFRETGKSASSKRLMLQKTNKPTPGLIPNLRLRLSGDTHTRKLNSHILPRSFPRKKLQEMLGSDKFEGVLTQWEFSLQFDEWKRKFPLKVVGVGVERFQKLRQEFVDQFLVPRILYKDFMEKREVFKLWVSSQGGNTSLGLNEHH